MRINKITKTSTAEALEKLIEFVERFRKNVDWYGIDGYYDTCYRKDIKELEGRVAFSRRVLEASKTAVAVKKEQ